MSEERHGEGAEPTVLLGPGVVAEVAPDDDEIAVEEGEPESLSAPPPGPEPPKATQSNVTPVVPGDPARRARGRMMLRIPDDEVVRPSDPAPPLVGSTREPQATPEPAPAARRSSAPDLAPVARRPSAPDPFEEKWTGPAVSTSRIITINPPASAEELGLPPWEEPPKPPPPPPTTLKELDGGGGSSAGTATKASELPAGADHSAHAGDATQTADTGLPPSADIVVDEDISEPLPPSPPRSSELEEPLHPPGPSEPPETASQKPDPILSAVQEMAAELGMALTESAAEAPLLTTPSETALDPEDVGLKSEPPPRSSEPGELAEVSAEDFVSVEAVPARIVGKGPVPAPPNHAPAKSSALTPTAAPAVSKPVAPPPPPPLAAPPPRLVPVPGSSPLAPPPMSETAATRRRARPWWEELFNDDFIRTMARITDAQIALEVNFIEESLGLAKNAVVLDLACGTGRHAIEMARRGYQIVGFDLSLAMLARAADEAQERDQKLNFVQGDMREMTFGETFDGVYTWNTSFGFFDEEKNNGVIANVHRALKAGGLFLLDVINRDYLARQAPSLAWFEGDGCVCMDEMHVDWITSRMRVKRTMMLDDGRTKETDYSLRVYSLHELGKILHDQGFRVAEVSGRVATPGVFFGADSPRILVVAEKR
jgi:SAM-dependent methyltransferase